MSIIYFCGTLDDGINTGYTPTNQNPIAIRGYDTAGNLLSAIKLGGPVPFISERVVTEPVFGGVGIERAFHAFDGAGNPILAALIRGTGGTSEFPSAAQMALYESPRLIRALPDGRIYCFCSLYTGTGGTMTDINSVMAAPVPGPYIRPFVEPFRCYDSNGHRLSAPSIYGEVECFAVDTDGNIYVGGIAIFAHLGIAPPTYHEFIYALGVGETAVGLGTDVLRKYAPDGTLLWSVPGDPRRFTPWDNGNYPLGVFSSITALEIGPDGYLYATGSGGDRGNKFVVYKFDPETGDEVWRRMVPVTVSIAHGGSLAVHSNGVYASSDGSDGAIVRLDLATGAVLASQFRNQDQPGWPRGLCIASGALHRFTAYDSNDIGWRLFDLDDLTLLESRPLYTDLRRRVATSADGGIYLSGPRWGPSGAPGHIAAYHFWAFHSAGSRRWENVVASAREGTDKFGVHWLDEWVARAAEDPAGDPLAETAARLAAMVTTDAYGRTVGPDKVLNAFGALIEFWKCYDVCVVDHPQLQSVSLALRVAEPKPSVIAMRVSAIPLGLRVAPPIWRREYVGREPQQTIYRVSVRADGFAPVTLSMQSVSVRREGQQLSIAVVASGLSLPLALALSERRAGSIAVQHGVRFPATGYVQVDDWLVAPLQSIRYDGGPRSLSLSLAAQGPAEHRAPEVRAVRGIRSREVTGGRLSLRCAFDPFIQPGDTATFGTETLMVGAVEHRVEPMDAWTLLTEGEA